jgi:hypothetical protein
MRDVMKNDPRNGELDRILAQTEILPSSGFTASVMDAVRHEASAPPPIPFPWKRALPGLAVAGGMLVLLLVVSIVQLARGAGSAPLPEAWGTALHLIEQATLRFGGQWVALALLSSYACVKFSALFLAKRI